MPGAIVGDIVGSVYEFDNHRSKDFPSFREDSHFTDDTILTITTAEALASGWYSDPKFIEDYLTNLSSTASRNMSGGNKPCSRIKSWNSRCLKSSPNFNSSSVRKLIRFIKPK